MIPAPVVTVIISSLSRFDVHEWILMSATKALHVAHSSKFTAPVWLWAQARL